MRRKHQFGLVTLLIVAMLLGPLLGFALQQWFENPKDEKRQDVLAEWERIWNLDAKPTGS